MSRGHKLLTKELVCGCCDGAMVGVTVRAFDAKRGEFYISESYDECPRCRRCDEEPATLCKDAKA